MAAWVPKEWGRERKAEVRREEAGGPAAGCSWSLWPGGDPWAPSHSPGGARWQQGAGGAGLEGGSRAPELVHPVRQLVVSQHHRGLGKDVSIPDVGGVAFRREQ